MANWMAGAKASIKRRGTEGVFKRAAARQGMSTGGYASNVIARNKKWKANHPGEKEPATMAKAGKRAALAKAFAHSR